MSKHILFVDDTRTFPPRPDDLVTTCRTSEEALVELQHASDPFVEIWLDFDLGGVYGQADLYDTAMPVALWLAEQAHYGHPYPATIMIHTGNPVGRLAMGLLLRRLGYDVADVEPPFGRGRDGVVMTDTTPTPPVTERPLEPIPQGSESLEVWAVNREPWEKLGTIIRRGGRHGTITCTPKGLDCLLRRPALLGYDPLDFLTGWCNTAVACWPKGKAPGAPTAY